MDETILTRVSAVSDTSAHDVVYLQGLRETVSAAIGFALAGIERGEERSGPVPPVILAQARLAAASGVGLQVVLRRYASGYSALSDFLMQEMRPGEAGPGVGPDALYALQRELTALFDRLLDTVSGEYERAEAPLVPAERLAERVKRLLAGALVDTSGLEYDLDGWHLGIFAVGPGASAELRELAAAADRRLLRVAGGRDTVFGWLGGRHRPDPVAVAEMAASAQSSQASLALGEPARGLSGWRLTHRQAGAALEVARRRPQPVTRYGDVALLASIARDEDLIAYLNETFLAAIREDRDDGETLCRTLRAYFAAGRNVSSAAAALGVTRHTVSSRLRTIEQRVARSIDSCGTELDITLRLLDDRFALS